MAFSGSVWLIQALKSFPGSWTHDFPPQGWVCPFKHSLTSGSVPLSPLISTQSFGVSREGTCFPGEHTGSERQTCPRLHSLN